MLLLFKWDSEPYVCELSAKCSAIAVTRQGKLHIPPVFIPLKHGTILWFILRQLTLTEFNDLASADIKCRKNWRSKNRSTLNSLSIPFGFVYVYNALKFEGRTIFFINSFSMGVGICYVIKLHWIYWKCFGRIKTTIKVSHNKGKII